MKGVECVERVERESGVEEVGGQVGEMERQVWGMGKDGRGAGNPRARTSSSSNSGLSNHRNSSSNRRSECSHSNSSSNRRAGCSNSNSSTRRPGCSRSNNNRSSSRKQSGGRGGVPTSGAVEGPRWRWDVESNHHGLDDTGLNPLSTGGQVPPMGWAPTQPLPGPLPQAPPLPVTPSRVARQVGAPAGPRR